MKISTKITMAVLQLLIFTAVRAQNNFWKDASAPGTQSGTQKRVIVAEKSRTVTLAFDDVKQFLKTVPKENAFASRGAKSIIAIPMPYGGFQNFSVVEVAMMEPALAALVPDIKTYGGQGIDDPSATIKIDISPSGFRAMVLSSVNGAVFIDPYYRNATDAYTVYYKKDFKSNKTLIEGERYLKKEKLKSALQNRTNAGPCIGSNLKIYRLAVACTGEYASAVGATTKQQALSAIVTSINRVSGIYEKELAIRLRLVADELKVIFINATTDRFQGNNNADVLIDESQAVITDSIGTANFDVGHTFSTGGGGLAGLGVVCRPTEKASGITGSPSPTGDPYDVDYVAHEIGHQFGATHTFNATTSNCSGNGETLANVEPGGGSTIMAYAGICGINDLQDNSDPQFHAISLQQIATYISGVGSCGVDSTVNNLAPTVNAGADFTIPKSTPFVVTGSAVDPNGDALTYSWEELDFGGPFGNAGNPGGQAPLFRSFPPVVPAFRVFPRITDLINNVVNKGEILPSYGRDINLRLTARDNRAGAGGVCSDDMKIVVAANAGPFELSAPNTAITWQAGSFQTVTWNINGTNQAPVNCANVSISLSTDGGVTYPISILASTPNDGSEEIRVPVNTTAQARIRVMAVGNIFFDISNTNFTIQAATTPEFVFNRPNVTTKCDGVNPSTTLRTSGLAGFTSPITLTATGVPAGTTVVFSSNPVTPGSDVTVTLQGSLAGGKYSVTVNGQAGVINKSQVLEFVVGPLAALATLTSPANNATGQSLLPTFNWSAISGAASYTLEISTNSNFTTLVQTVSSIAQPGTTLNAPLLENTIYYWRIKTVNACGTGFGSLASLFKTTATICDTVVVSKDVPKIIPAAGVTTTNSTIVIVNGVIVSDINVVGLKGTHDYISDIDFTLTSPSNTTITLFDQICDAEKNFDLNLDDEATTGVFPCPPINGVTVRPSEPLSSFDGQSSFGTWVLAVTDHFDTDGGTLTAWGLRICSNVATPLPVNWLTFTAQKSNNNSISLQWSTANEVKNHFYNIERSSNGINFSAIGKMTGGNNLSMLQQYFFNDLKPLNGVNYYRLKQVDVDGQFSYSAIVKVIMEGGKLLWTIYPNPAHGQATIRLLSNNAKVNVLLTDALGKVVYRKNVIATKAGDNLVLPLENIARGVYFVKVETDGTTKTERIIVK